MAQILVVKSAQLSKICVRDDTFCVSMFTDYMQSRIPGMTQYHQDGVKSFALDSN